jgi:hypothetical protein
MYTNDSICRIIYVCLGVVGGVNLDLKKGHHFCQIREDAQLREREGGGGRRRRRRRKGQPAA